MERSDEVRDVLLRFYERFSSGDVDRLADLIASGPEVSVIGTEQGPSDRESWLHTYETQIAPIGITFRPGNDLVGYRGGSVAFANDTPTVFLPDGRYAPTRMTAVLHQEDGEWKIVHLHFSVGVGDEEAIQPPD